MGTKEETEDKMELEAVAHPKAEEEAHPNGDLDVDRYASSKATSDDVQSCQRQMRRPKRRARRWTLRCSKRPRMAAKAELEKGGSGGGGPRVGGQQLDSTRAAKINNEATWQMKP